MSIKKSFVFILIIILFLGVFSFSASAEEVAPIQDPAPVCSSTDLSLCTTEVLCAGVNLYWYGGVCNLVVEPAPIIVVPTCTALQTLVNNVCTDPVVIVPTCTALQTLVNNVCTDPVIIVPICTGQQTLVNNVCTDPAKAPEIIPEPEPEVIQVPIPKLEPIPDKATSPSSAKLTVLMPDGTPPPFPVFVTFVGVGNKNYGGKINNNGEANVIIPSGRYYTDIMPINTDYVQGEDGPSFFMEADATRDFGVIKLKLKKDVTNQNIQEKTLEENIIKDAQTQSGMGKILALIVKLLMKILEAVTALAIK
jgi:hypothetical protein